MIAAWQTKCGNTITPSAMRIPPSPPLPEGEGGRGQDQDASGAGVPECSGGVCEVDDPVLVGAADPLLVGLLDADGVPDDEGPDLVGLGLDGVPGSEVTGRRE